MKLRTRILLIAGILLVVLCGAGGWLVSSYVRSTTMALQDEARETGDAILTSLGRKWSLDELREAASADFLSAVPDEDQKVKWLARMKEDLGAFKSGRGIVTAIAPVKGVEGKDILSLTYTNEAQFEKRKAKVRLVLVYREKGGWQMASFDADPLKG